jgi:AcrR family transcriptional regulator
LAIVRDEGLEKLSLREVARRLGVSHGAPYKHFGSRDHILAEVVARAFADFAAHLDARPRTGRPHDDLAEMGRAYLSYALAQPLNYRLMFSTTLPDPDTHPCMMREARHAFALLRDGLRAVHAAERRVASEDSLNLDAMFVWATMHGLAGVMIGDSIRQIGLPARVLSQMQPHVLGCISAALDLPAPSTS